MEKRCRDGDPDFKPNTRTYTSVIDSWAKSGEKGAALRAEQILNSMISRYEAAGDPDVKPNVHTTNAVCNVSKFCSRIVIAFSFVYLTPVFYRLVHSRNIPTIGKKHCK